MDDLIFETGEPQEEHSGEAAVPVTADSDSVLARINAKLDVLLMANDINPASVDQEVNSE